MIYFLKSNYRSVLLFALAFLFISVITPAQTSPDYHNLKKLYGGVWYNKEAKRYLTINFDDSVDYATINDWVGKLKSSKNIDAYKAFIHGDTLIMYADNEEHRSGYCEISILNDTLIFQCNSGLNFTDQFLNNQASIDKTIFIRIRD